MISPHSILRQFMMSCSVIALCVVAFAPHALAGNDDEPDTGIPAKASVNPLPGDLANTPNMRFLNQLKDVKALPSYNSRRNAILKDMAKTPAKSYMSMSRALPEDDPTRHDILRMIGLNENYSFGERLEAVKNLPMDDKMRNDFLSKWTYNSPIQYHLPAALALPENDPTRNRALQKIIKDNDYSWDKRMTAAMALPEDDPIRDQFLQSVAQDTKETFFHQLQATKALSVNNPVRKDLLYAFAQMGTLYVAERLQAVEALPADDPLRDKLVRAWVQVPAWVQDETQDETIGFDPLFSAVKLLPLEEQNSFFHKWVDMDELEFSDRVRAVKALPQDDEVRKQRVLEWAQDPDLDAPDRLELAYLLPEGELKTKLIKELKEIIDNY